MLANVRFISPEHQSSGLPFRKLPSKKMLFLLILLTNIVNVCLLSSECQSPER
uniref:Uncharacterized protein n=1 Tax=Rhizophagus irregularis (strain DAOM 181602 / DAOM 197198 / MUCL 43194) TaxID=747089 RepID=U9U858_RHIID